MDQLKSRAPLLLVVALIIAGAAYYLVTGGSSTSGDGKTNKPHDTFVMTVSSVQPDGTFRGKIERSDRHAKKGLAKVGTYDYVTLRLADLQELDPVRDDCWAQEGVDAIQDLIGGRIEIDPDTVEEDSSGRFLVHAWTKDDAFIQQELLEAGDATLYSGHVGPTHKKVLEDAEAEAAKAEKGRWATCGAEK